MRTTFHRVLPQFLVALAISSAGAAVDLTPVVEEYTQEGFTYRKVTLKGDHGTVTFTLPQGWEIRGGKDRLQLIPLNKRFVEAAIESSPLAAPQPFDEVTVKALEQQVLASAPPQCQSLQVVRTAENPVMMGTNLSYEFVISYALLGQSFQRSFIVVNTPDTRLVFRITAPKPDFDLLHDLFRRSIASWTWIPAEQPPQTTEPATLPVPGQPESGGRPAN